MDRKKVIKEFSDFVKSFSKRDDTYYKGLFNSVLALLKEQEESIPVYWLEEKLEGHPELPYAITDGINNVLELWEGR